MGLSAGGATGRTTYHPHQNDILEFAKQCGITEESQVGHISDMNNIRVNV